MPAVCFAGTIFSRRVIWLPTSERHPPGNYFERLYCCFPSFGKHMGGPSRRKDKLLIYVEPIVYTKENSLKLFVWVRHASGLCFLSVDLQCSQYRPVSIGKSKLSDPFLVWSKHYSGGLVTHTAASFLSLV
jgi:hypothetical protein